MPLEDSSTGGNESVTIPASTYDAGVSAAGVSSISKVDFNGSGITRAYGPMGWFAVSSQLNAWISAILAAHGNSARILDTIRGG